MEVAAVGVWNVTTVYMRKGHGMGAGLYNDAALPEFHQAGTLCRRGQPVRGWCDPHVARPLADVQRLGGDGSLAFGECSRMLKAGGVCCGLMTRRASTTINLHDREDAEVLMFLLSAGQSIFVMGRCMHSVTSHRSRFFGACNERPDEQGWRLQPLVVAMQEPTEGTSNVTTHKNRRPTTSVSTSQRHPQLLQFPPSLARSRRSHQTCALFSGSGMRATQNARVPGRGPPENTQ
ncbi:predicted protein [Verticillium alfalfae VaMs.102]|uniref:Predicted protein n=1 Tax=Verticillium alfalfae (strain VaMs.102 / ATCC MYA-4576 / FGSC 10136) TaxID=526221 RepID=C9SSX6_VERA1|nr:predicted protein [Verticillium alfalfae VaMs.102]EEY21891.1 predicted protein [Verticillium alfalfae VaMs.102]